MATRRKKTRWEIIDGKRVYLTTITGKPPKTTKKPTSRSYKGVKASNIEQLKELEKERGRVTDPERLELAQARAKKAGTYGPTEITPSGEYVYPLEKEQREAEVKRTREEAGIKFLEEKGFFGEERPETAELGIPKRIGAEQAPIIGPSLAAISEVIDPEELLRAITGVPLKKEWFGLTDPEELRPLIENPETLREMALREIQKEVIAESITGAERFGAVIEAIPIAGPKVAKWVGETVEDPSTNVNTIVDEVGRVGTRAMNMREKALTGKMGDPYIAYAQLLDMERRMAAMEQRIKLLAAQSAILQADGDAVNLIEEKILDSKQRIFDAKQSAAAGIVGTSSDSSIFLTLKEMKGGG